MKFMLWLPHVFCDKKFNNWSGKCGICGKIILTWNDSVPYHQLWDIIFVYGFMVDVADRLSCCTFITLKCQEREEKNTNQIWNLQATVKKFYVSFTKFMW